MREILFKAKRLDNGEWVEGYYQKRKDAFENDEHLIFRCESYHTWEYVEVNPDTICQYTGLTDKNGNKIWENDVCSAILVDGRENCIVKYGRRAENFKLELGFNLEWTKTNYFRCDICYWSENEKLEVIGNIFDNPELLERMR